MLFNPINKALYTNNGKLIKKMYCPYSSLSWNDLSHIDSSADKFCTICESNVVETNNMSGNSLFELLQNHPKTCLKIDFNQKNIRIVHHV